MVWSIFDYESDFITTTRGDINGIPCLKFRPNGYKGVLPTVIFYHGWHSSKEFIKFRAQIIAINGYQVIVPDALHHGDRDPIDHDAPQNLEKYIWKIILQSVKESKGFIETIVDEHEADSTRIGIIGSSMGAITAGGIFVDNPAIKCLVGFNGAFAWEELIKRNYLKSDILDLDDKELIKYYDPISKADKLNNRPILILHGTEDTLVTIESQRVFFNKMLPVYAENPEKLRFIEENDINHRITIEMMQEAVTWFKKYL